MTTCVRVTEEDLLLLLREENKQGFKHKTKRFSKVVSFCLFLYVKTSAQKTLMLHFGHMKKCVKRQTEQRCGICQGLRSKKCLAHGLLDLALFPSMPAYCCSLERGPRRTLLAQTDAAFLKHDVRHSSRSSTSGLGWEHLRVAIAHEGRVLPSRMKAGLAGLSRFVIAKLMTGVVDEFRGSDGHLLAWSQSMAKGAALRGMWYYAHPEADKMCIWFYNARLQVSRALASGLRYVDAGPSTNAAVEGLKQKYGFAPVANWNELEAYAGDWMPLISRLNTSLDTAQTTLLLHEVKSDSLPSDAPETVPIPKPRRPKTEKVVEKERSRKGEFPSRKERIAQSKAAARASADLTISE